MAKGWGRKPIGTRQVCTHEKLPGMALGWLVCRQMCGWAGVCRTCLAEARLVVPQEVPWAVCSRHWAGVQSGTFRCVDGYVVPVEVFLMYGEDDEAYQVAGGMLAEE